MEGVERRLNADFPLPFFRMNLFVAVARVEFVAFLKKQPSHAWDSLFSRKSSCN